MLTISPPPPPRTTTAMEKVCMVKRWMCILCKGIGNSCIQGYVWEKKISKTKCGGGGGDHIQRSNRRMVVNMIHFFYVFFLFLGTD